MRTKIVAGNWKMNKNSEETEDLLNELIDNFYRLITPITKNVTSCIIKYRDKSILETYRDIGEKIYEDEINGFISKNENIQNNYIEEFKKLEYTCERLIELDNMNNDISDDYIYEGQKVIENVLGGKIKLNESIQINPKRYLQLLGILVDDCCSKEGVSKPKITIINNDKYSTQNKSFGGYLPGTKEIKLVIYSRTGKDSMVTLRHELEHYFQDLRGELTNDSGRDGDEVENSANAKAAEYLRGFGRKYPEIYTLKYDNN